MIAFFSDPYPDELVYSWLARFQLKAGYPGYIGAAEELFTSPWSSIPVDFFPSCTPQALRVMTQILPIENIILDHTMFPYYARFLPHTRQQKAFQSLLNMDGQYFNDLQLPKHLSDVRRYLRYCPYCVTEDRIRYGETYWHRMHQLPYIRICPMHGSVLSDSTFSVRSRQGPSLKTAEEVIPCAAEHTTDADTPDTAENRNNMTTATMSMHENSSIIPSPIIVEKAERELAAYIWSVFETKMDMQQDVPVGSFLNYRLWGTPYTSPRGGNRYIHKLFHDFSRYYGTMPYNPVSSAWQLTHIFDNNSYLTASVCMLGMFLGISPEDLCYRTIPSNTPAEQFDTQVMRLCHDGMKTAAIARELGADIQLIRKVIKAADAGKPAGYYAAVHTLNGGGPHPADRSKEDLSVLSSIPGIIRRLHGETGERPRRISLTSIASLSGFRAEHLRLLPLSLAEASRHVETIDVFWARKVIWAARRIDKPLSEWQITDFTQITNMSRKQIASSVPHLPLFADEEVCSRITALIQA